MFARALRTVGKRTDLVVGTDDHQSYVATRAFAKGVPPREFCSFHGDQLVATLGAVGFDATYVYRPEQDADYAARVSRLFAVLRDSPAVARTEVETAWCEACERSVYQAFASGRCPTCAQDCDGEICEDCGRPNEARQLVQLACRQCGATPVTRLESALLLDMEMFAEPVEHHLAAVQGSGSLRLLCQQLIAEGLGTYRLTRHSPWGIDLAAYGMPGEVVDPWVELVLAHLDNMRRAALDDSARGVAFLGFDNSYYYYYAILLPVLACALGQESLLPYGYVVNDLLRLDGDKFSTSRNHAVWVDDLLQETPRDVVRLASVRRAPEQGVSNVTRAEIAAVLDDPLLAGLRTWFDGLPANGVVPGTGAWTVAHREFYRGLSLASRTLDALLSPETFSSVAYVRQLDSLVASALAFRGAERDKRLLKGKSEEARTSLALEYLATKAMAAFMYPVMPDLGCRVWRATGFEGLPRRELDWTFPPAGTVV